LELIIVDTPANIRSIIMKFQEELVAEIVSFQQKVMAIFSRQNEALKNETISTPHLKPPLKTISKSLAHKEEKENCFKDQTDNNQCRWMTVMEAANLLDICSGVISRASEKKHIITNGKRGRERRLDKISVVDWGLKRAFKKNYLSEKKDYGTTS
jgi:hypothetical protein